MKFYKYIYCLKSLLGLTQTQFLCMLFFGHLYNAKQSLPGCIKTQLFPVFRGSKHSKLMKSEKQDIFISTIFVTSVILYKVDIFFCVCPELASADCYCYCTFLCQSMPVYGLFSWYYFRLWKLIKIKLFRDSVRCFYRLVGSS